MECNPISIIKKLGVYMKYIIREMQSYEYYLLKDFLYETIFQPDENNLIPKSIIENQSLKYT